MNRRQFCKSISAALVGVRTAPLFGATPALVPSHDPLELILDAPLDHPFFSWPRTLLSWHIPVEYFPRGVTFQILCSETGKTVPFQIASQSSKRGEKQVLFFADLPAGARRIYTLQSAAHADSEEPGIVIRTERDSILIDPGPIQIRIPVSQQISGAAAGPILQICREGKWTGASVFHIPGHPVSSIRTELLEAGPLRSSHRITYTTRTGFAYIARVECYAGVDYFRIFEDMESLPADAHGEIDFAWTGCEFNWRQAPNHPYDFPSTPIGQYEKYPWEQIGPEYINSQFGVAHGLSRDGRFPFSLRVFEPWADVAAASFANFWSDQSGDAAAIFIDRIDLWQDHEYAIWHSSTKLAVEFAYRQGTLYFLWKLGRGTRSACMAFYDHAKDVEAMARLEYHARGITTAAGNYGTDIFPDSYALNLQNWYGTLSLDKIKGWSLTYPTDKAQPQTLFRSVPWKTAAEFSKELEQAGMITKLALSGLRQNNGFGPTSSRQIYLWLAGFQVFHGQMDAAQLRCMTAYLLLLAYVHAGEDYMPMRSMLAGHPNFLADVKSVPAAISFLFPEHPAANTWSEEWEAYLRLNTHYHTRPEVREWYARGGRWTENLGTYVWAFLRPTLWASFLLKCRDGYERLTTPELALMGDWLVNALSAPFAGESPETLKMIAEASAKSEGAQRHYWGIVNSADGARRTHLPIGAHSERRKPPRAMWYLGTALMHYSPLIAEHLMWAARPTDQDMEQPLNEPDPFEVMYSQPDNGGTNPHLRSSKYTGYGITLRASVDTPREISIHLMQIDDGPNYRWGNGTEGACGVVYFYANGKGYSYNGMEDEGDRIDQNTDFGSNFGVWKDGSFRCIGQNVLTRPLYDLGIAQFAQLVPRSGANVYSWPEYVSRNILLAGDDYFILYDQVFDAQVANRFSWFVRKGDDFPQITFLDKSQGKDDRQFTSLKTDTSTGMWADSMGDCVALITHREGIHAEPTMFGGGYSCPKAPI